MPQPEQEYARELVLPSGVRLSLYSYRCASPSLECTAPVQSHLLSESPDVANRIVEWLAEQPVMEQFGVTWWTCGEDRHVLTYPTPAEAKVVTALGAISVDEFRTSHSRPTAFHDGDDVWTNVKLPEWSFIPGPEWDPPDSSLNLHDLIEYPPGDIAEAILAFPGMIVQNPGEPTWWNWLARWQHGEETIDVGMSLFETEPASWGGSPLQGRCSAKRLLSLWESIRQKFPAVWLHNSDCEIHTPESFRQLFSANEFEDHPDC